MLEFFFPFFFSFFFFTTVKDAQIAPSKRVSDDLGSKCASNTSFSYFSSFFFSSLSSFKVQLTGKWSGIKAWQRAEDFHYRAHRACRRAACLYGIRSRYR